MEKGVCPFNCTIEDDDDAPEDRKADFAEPVRAIRTFETAIENIIGAIERNRLRAGDRLPNESELARQLAISKPTLRQALRVLERSGLLLDDLNAAAVDARWPRKGHRRSSERGQLRGLHRRLRRASTS